MGPAPRQRLLTQNGLRTRRRRLRPKSSGTGAAPLLAESLQRSRERPRESTGQLARVPLLAGSGWCGQGLRFLGAPPGPDLLGLWLRGCEGGTVSRHGISPVLFSFSQPIFF